MIQIRFLGARANIPNGAFRQGIRSKADGKGGIEKTVTVVYNGTTRTFAEGSVPKGVQRAMNNYQKSKEKASK
jgi:hypothetical protein